MKRIAAIFLIFSSQSFTQISIKGDEPFAPLVAAYRADFSNMIGYRIQICFDSDKAVADEAKRKFVSLHPKTDVYMVFENPNFNLMVGDFRTKFDAEIMRAKIQGEFTISISHKTNIKLPRVD
jgi:hypothetical protein